MVTAGSEWLKLFSKMTSIKYLMHIPLYLVLRLGLALPFSLDHDINILVPLMIIDHFHIIKLIQFVMLVSGREAEEVNNINIDYLHSLVTFIK